MQLLTSCAKTVASAVLWVVLALPVNADDSDRKDVPVLRGTISSFPAAQRQNESLPTGSALNALASADWTPAPQQGANSQSSEENKGDDDSEKESKSGNGEDENKSTDKKEGDKHVHFELTADATSQGGYYVNSKTLIAPFTGLDSSGFRLTINLTKGGGRHHNGETDEINKYEFTSADFMFGYAVEREKLSMKFMMGANVADYLLSVPDPTNPMQGTELGVKFDWEMESDFAKYNMIYAKANYSTAFNTYYVQFQYGYDITCGNELYVGPEFVALGHRTYNEYRLGVHLSEIKLGKVNVGLAGGAMWNDDLGRGAYGTVYMNLKF